MTRSTVISFIVVLSAAYCIGQPARQCSDPNAVWNNCTSHCQPMCIMPTMPHTCPPMCVARCVCKPGYILGPAGKCISRDECVRRVNCVGPSQFWNNCSNDCEPTCMPREQPPVCCSTCVGRCSCAPGYIRGPGRNCITTKECANLKSCGLNEEWSDCGNYCEPRCIETPKRPVCPHICIPKCMCKRGFVRTQDGRCVQRSECVIC